MLADGAGVYTPKIARHTTGGTHVYHQDFLGTNEAETDASQVTQATRSYDAFGMAVTGPGPLNGPFGYAGNFGYQEDNDSGLKLLGHRYYDPSTGRFITRDPEQAGRNWYGYCKNNPLASIDATGLDQKTLDLIRKLISRGLLPRGSDDKYKNDPKVRDRIHRKYGKWKKKNNRKDKPNKDVPEDDATKILQGEFGTPLTWEDVFPGQTQGLPNLIPDTGFGLPTTFPGIHQEVPPSQGNSGIDWGAVGAGAGLVVGTVAAGIAIWLNPELAPWIIRLWGGVAGGLAGRLSYGPGG